MLLSPNYKYTFNLTDESQVWYPGKSHTVVHAVPYKLGTFSMMRVKFDTEEEIEQIHLDKVHITSAYAVGSSERSFCPQPHPRALEKGKWYALYDVCWREDATGDSGPLTSAWKDGERWQGHLNLKLMGAWVEIKMKIHSEKCSCAWLCMCVVMEVEEWKSRKVKEYQSRRRGRRR